MSSVFKLAKIRDDLLKYSNKDDIKDHVDYTNGVLDMYNLARKMLGEEE